MKKLTLLLFISFSATAFSQNDSIPTFWDHVKFGGGFGFGFGSNNTTLAIAPSAIYTFNDQFAFGVTTSYLYSKNYNLKTNVFGAGLVGLYNPFEFLQVSAEFEQSFASQKMGFEKEHFNFPALYVGLAYRSGWFGAGLRYDILYDENESIYASAFSPIVRFYF